MDNLVTPLDYERVVLDNLPLVDAIIRSIARRHRLSADDRDELGAAIRLKLVDRDYEVLRRFKNESSLRTYLNTIINRQVLDRRTAAWGKWRPSAAARRLGPHAVLLDQLVTRDGVAVEQAVERALATYDVPRRELEAIATQLPPRTTRRFAGDEDLADVPAPMDERHLIDAIDQSKSRGTVPSSLTAALEQLEAQDRLILKMKFCDGFTVARIAQVLALDQKGLYRRLSSILEVLRRELLHRGVSAAQVTALVGHAATDLPATLASAVETAGRGPSLSLRTDTRRARGNP